MKKKMKVILLGSISIFAIVGLSIGSYFIYEHFHSKKILLDNSKNTSTNFFVEIQASSTSLKNHSNTILNQNFIDDNREEIINSVKNNSNFQNLPKDSIISNWGISFNEYKGVITVNYTTNMYYKDGEIISSNEIILNDIVGFKKEEFKITINADPSNDYVVGSNVSFSANVTNSQGQQITDFNNLGITTKWTIDNGESIFYNGLNADINLMNTGNHNLKFIITYHDTIGNDVTWSSMYSFNVLEKKFSLPTDSELLINNGKELKYNKWIPLKKSENELKNITNKYGVLNTFSLITKIYSDSNIMNSLLFSNIEVSLIENRNYDYLKFQITGNAKINISSFGKFPFADLVQGWNGLQINKGDQVKVVFEYNRSSNSLAKGKNQFDLSNVSYGVNLSSISNVTWKFLKDTVLNLPFTTDFNGRCGIWVNNRLERQSSYENRVHFAIIYNHVDEYNQFGNKDVNVLCDNNAKL